MPSPQLEALIAEVSNLLHQNKEHEAHIESLKRGISSAHKELFSLRQKIKKLKESAEAKQTGESQATDGDAPPKGDLSPEGLNVVLLIRQNIQAFSSQLPRHEAPKIISRFLPFIVELSANGIELNPVLRKPTAQ